MLGRGEIKPVYLITGNIPRNRLSQSAEEWNAELSRRPADANACARQNPQQVKRKHL